MCWAEKFCFCVPLNLGCVLYGVFNIVCATPIAIASIIHFASYTWVSLDSPGNHTSAMFKLEMKQVSLDINFALLLTVALCWILFSLILILGVIRNKSSFILAYFFFGILLVIFGNLSALLLVLRSCLACLELGLITFFFSILHIHFLVAVYTVYELMQRGKDFRFHKSINGDVDLLIAEDFI